MSQKTVTVPLVNVRVRRDAQTINHTTVPPYEVGVLKENFGADNVTVEGDAGVTRDIDPAGEHERLGAKYGASKVEALFGKAAAGRVEELVLKAAEGKPAKAGKAAAAAAS